jgi:hypothetical protein
MIAPLTSSVWEGWGSVVVISIVLVMIGGVIMVGAWQGIKTAQADHIARETVARDEAYRKLAEDLATSQRNSADAQRRIADSLTDVGTKVNAIERMLREVG